MSETRDFPLYSVLGVLTDLPMELDPYMDILQWMVGTPLSIVTARPAKVACAEWIRTTHPLLRSIPAESGFKAGDDEASMDAWVADLARTLRDPMPIERLPADRWRSPSDLDVLKQHGALPKTYVAGP